MSDHASDKETGEIPQKKADDLRDEAAAAKLWAVYVSEAEKYDRALVASWKGDMEGMLIFAGLFSAILTAFLVESYKTLNSDSADLTVQLLAQISQQLAASTNGSAVFQVSPSTPFTPSATSFVCNGLWFISLGFSLGCALLATLVEQWAREFIHRADMHSSPVIRARIFSYLYYGLKGFHMHTVVEIIPLLLHASLVFFFGGLVAFLIPVSYAMTVIAAVLLVIITSVYSALTFLPLRYFDSPYRTPLSSACWRLLQIFKRIWRHRWHGQVLAKPMDPSPDETMVEAMSRTAMKHSWERVQRDHKALVWTMKSLADDVELEPFVEAIPDLLWAPRGRRYTYEEQNGRLIHNTDVQLLNRVAALHDSCDTGILPLVASKRRRIICFKAFWALAVLSCENPRRTVDFRAFLHIYTAKMESAVDPTDSEIVPYFTSAKAIMSWTIFCAAQPRLIAMRKDLMESLASRGNTDEDLSEVSYFVRTLYSDFSRMNLRMNPDTLHPALWHSEWPAMTVAPKLLAAIEELLFNMPYNLLFQYLAESASLVSPPYHWGETRDAIRLDSSVPFSAFQAQLECRLPSVIFTRIDMLSTTSDATKLAWIDTSVSTLLSFWRPDDTSVPIPGAIIELLNAPEYEGASADLLRARGDVEFYLWSNFPATLSMGASNMTASGIFGPELPQEDVFTALWRLASLPPKFHSQRPLSTLSTQRESVLNALSNNTDPSCVHISRSVAALLKVVSLDVPADADERGEAPVSWFNRVSGVFPAETANAIRDTDTQVEWSTVRKCIWGRNTEALISTLAEFLEHCASDVLPYKAVETLKRMNHISFPWAVHHTHQLRLADSIHGIFAAERFADLLAVVVNFWCWHIYAEQRNDQTGQDQWVGPRIPWLDNIKARQKIKTAFTEYAQNLASVADGGGVLARVQNILVGLDYWHPADLA